MKIDKSLLLTRQWNLKWNLKGLSLIKELTGAEVEEFKGPVPKNRVEFKGPVPKNRVDWG